MTYNTIQYNNIQYNTNNSIQYNTIQQARRKQVSIRGWGWLTDLSSGYDIMLPLNLLKTIFLSLLIRFIMIIDGKYKTS